MALYVNGHKVAPIIKSETQPIRIPLSTKKDVDIDLTEHELCSGISNYGTSTRNKVIETGTTLPSGYFHYEVEAKFMLTDYPATSFYSILSTPNNSYNCFRIGIDTSGKVFCRGWNRTNLYSNTVSLNEEHTVKLTYSNNTMRLWLDGVSQGTSSVSESTNSGELFIGTYYIDDTKASIGKIFNGTLFSVKMTDTTTNKVMVEWNRTIVDNDKPVVFVNGDSGTIIQELEWTVYNPTGKYACGFNPVKVDIPTKWGGTAEDFYNTSVSATPTLHDIVIPSGEFNKSLQYTFHKSTIKSFTAYSPALTGMQYCYQFLLAENPYLEDIKLLRGTSSGVYTSSYGLYSLAYNCTNLKHFYNDLFTIGTNSQGFYNLCCGCTQLIDAVFEKITTVNGTSAFQYAFQDCTNLTKFLLTSISTTTINNSSGNNIFNYAFKNCNKLYDENINRIQFPTVTTIGGTSTTYYGAFKNAFTTVTSTYYGKLHLIFPELTTINNRNTTAANGHFAYNNALGKIYLPKFTVDGTTGKNIFNNCNYLTEIHFGMENQTTIINLSGYTYKFGADDATIYFDMVNHITVNGVVYDRQGINYDYDNSYYSWNNGDNVIYTTNAINPAVNDTVYTKNGETYTSAGTISAIS